MPFFPADFLPLFGQKTGWLLERLGLSARLDPVLGIHLCCTALLHFLRQGPGWAAVAAVVAAASSATQSVRQRGRCCRSSKVSRWGESAIDGRNPAPLTRLCSLHLPLTEEQRAAQTWEPGKQGPARLRGR